MFVLVSMVCSSMLQLVFRCLGCVFLILLWEILFLQGMKIMFVGVRCVVQMVLCFVLEIMFMVLQFSVVEVLCMLFMYFGWKGQGGKYDICFSLMDSLVFLCIVFRQVSRFLCMCVSEFLLMLCRLMENFICFGIMLWLLGIICIWFIVLCLQGGQWLVMVIIFCMMQVDICSVFLWIFIGVGLVCDLKLVIVQLYYDSFSIVGIMLMMVLVFFSIGFCLMCVL